MTNSTLEVDRAAHGTTRLFESDETITDGQVLFRIDRFAMTANNVTYAAAGDLLGYWDFFPTEDGWGRVPAMGWAEVVESAAPGIDVGGRYYGWFPMARQVAITATPTADGLRDDGAHRSQHAAVYRAYLATGNDPWYQDGRDAEDRQALLRGLFLTGFLAEEFFADDGYHGADQVLVLSASSKTAIGFAQRAAARGGPAVVGLTSAGNAEFVRSLGYYDQVIDYDQLDDVADTSSVIIDMAGNAGLVATIHERLGDKIGHSMTVGMSHHDAPPAEITSGPSPQLFFAPTEVARRAAEWGAEAYRERTTSALLAFVEGSRSWLTVETAAGPEATAETWGALYRGAVPPATGMVATVHDA
ncbi:MAG: DUF2855 family protein [Actinomycetota bacterium]